MSFVSWFLKFATVLIFSIKNVRGTREDSENLKVIVEKGRVMILVWFCGQGKHLDGAGECVGCPPLARSPQQLPAQASKVRA